MSKKKEMRGLPHAPRGILKAAIISTTGCSDRNIDDYVEAGLLDHPTPRYARGHRGVVEYLYRPDSIARVQVIRERLYEVADYREAAFELFLRGLDPPDTEALRKALLLHLDQKVATYSFRQRQRAAPSTETSERQRIERALDHAAEAAGYSDETREMLRASALRLNGVARPYGTVHGVPPMPVPTYTEQREILVKVSPAVLIEAVAQTRQVIPRENWRLIQHWMQDAPWREEDQVRALLPGHLCRSQHSVKQAARPSAVISMILRLDPSLIPDSVYAFRRDPLQSLQYYNCLAPAALAETNDVIQYALRQRERG
jgi:hypothetical protein